MGARKKDESPLPEGWAASPETVLHQTGRRRPDVSELCREWVWGCDPSEDPVGRQIVETCGTANPEVRELQERGGKTRQGEERGPVVGVLGRGGWGELEEG